MHSVKANILLDHCSASDCVVQVNILLLPQPREGFLFNPQPDGNFTSFTYFTGHLKPSNCEFLNFLPKDGISCFLIIAKHGL